MRLNVMHTLMHFYKIDEDGDVNDTVKKGWHRLASYACRYETRVYAKRSSR